jgi:hypothetical protein
MSDRLLCSCLISLILSAIFLVPGCSKSAPRPDTVEVSGTVSFKGAPLKSGRISFQPKLPPKSQEFARPATATIKDGAYTLTSFAGGAGVIPGDYLVTVESYEKELTMEEINEGKKPKSVIPTKYKDPKTSGLTANVPDSGPVTIDFTLKP